MPSEAGDAAPRRSLRDRKRKRTRRAIIEAAVSLFEARGYEATTLADIAAAAEIGTRTFFGYFRSKDEILFPDVDARVDAVARAIAGRRADDRATDILMRALTEVAASGAGLTDRIGVLRMRLIQTVPAVRSRALQQQMYAERQIAAQLAAAFPDELDSVTAAALVGAFVGAVAGAMQALVDGSAAGPPDPEATRERLRRATGIALHAFRPEERSRQI